MSQVARDALRRELGVVLAGRNAAAERFAAEVEFAEGLIDLMPEKAKPWTRLLDKACQAVAAIVAAGKLDRLAKAVAEAEESLAPIGRAAKKYTVHCAGHAHIDMNWMWSWPETVAVTNDTFTTVLKLMDEFPDFRFTQSQASVYAIVQKYNPELFERIRRRIAEGRWEVVAAHWVEGDKNLAGGEALARHMLYTRRFCAEHLGLKPQDVPTEWEPDTFGHAATIPTIVSRGGVSRYYMCRGGVGWEKPPVFWWAGPDGSRILVNREVTWYNDHMGTHNARGLLSFVKSTGLKDWLCVFGVGDHGGGPTRRDLARIGEMNAWPVYPRFRMATTREYFDILEANGEKWPTLQRELNFEFTGCYTSQSRIKRFNRLAEAVLEAAEVNAVLAWRLLGRPYPAADLRQAWTEALFSHFHDILPGSGVRETREFNSAQFQQIAATTGMISTQSLRAVAAAIDTSALAAPKAGKPAQHPAAGKEFGAGPGHGTYWGGVSGASQAAGENRVFAVFNPTAWPRTETVKFTLWNTGDGSIEDAAFVARLADDSLRPVQRLGKVNAPFWGHQYIDLAVTVSVPPLGWTTLAIAPAGQNFRTPCSGYAAGTTGRAADLAAAVPPAVTSPDEYTLENEFVRVRLDKASGGIVELTDKTTGANVASPAAPTAVLEYLHERPGPMSSWTIHPPQRRVCPLEAASITRTASGPLVASIAVQSKIQDSSATVTYTLRAGAAMVEIDLDVDWFERGSRESGCPSLRLLVPLALADARATYEIPFGTLERAEKAGEEVPALRWADVTGSGASGAPAGVTLLNDSKHGHSLDGATLALSLIRSSYEPDLLPEIGRHTVRLALVPHGPRPAGAELVRMGIAFNQPLSPVSTDAHQGALPAEAGAIAAVEPAGVVLTAVKKAEDDDWAIFRFQETAGVAGEVNVKLNPAILGRAVMVDEVDLLEGYVANCSAGLIDGGFKVNIPAFGIASIKVKLEK